MILVKLTNNITISVIVVGIRTETSDIVILKSRGFHHFIKNMAERRRVKIASRRIIRERPVY
jgi:hypothetical protein